MSESAEPDPSSARSADAAATHPNTKSYLTLLLAYLGAVTMYVVQPPLVWAPLAVVAVVPWLLLIRMPQLPGKRPLRTTNDPLPLQQQGNFSPRINLQRL